VKFIDYGNDETVLASNMREIDGALQSYPAQATLCYVNGVQAAGGVWSEDSIRQLNDKVCYEEYLLEILGLFDFCCVSFCFPSQNPYFIHTYIGTYNNCPVIEIYFDSSKTSCISDWLLKTGCAIPCDLRKLNAQAAVLPPGEFCGIII